MPTESGHCRALVLALLAPLVALTGCGEATDDSGSTEAAATETPASVQSGLDSAVAKNEARMAALRSAPAKTQYRTTFGSEPYLKLHKGDDKVRGTVVVFHGFAGMPIQQNPLVDYLFSQGYDVFNASVAGHYKVNVPGSRRSFFGSNQLESGGLSTLDNTFVAWPYADYGHDPIKEYNAEVDATYEIMKTLRKPFFAAGLSAGATQAIRMGARYPNDFKRVVAFAPLLDLEAGKKGQLTQAAAIIATARIVVGGQWDGWFAWDKSNPFPQGCFWGLQKYGLSLVKTATSFTSHGQQLFLVTTDHEDAADSSKTKTFFSDAGGAVGGHSYYNYGKDQWVPHPIDAIDSRSQGTINFYYKTLFQETLRFLNEGRVKSERLGKQDLAPNDRGHDLSGYTPPSQMDWDVASFGGDAAKAIPAHVDLGSVR